MRIDKVGLVFLLGLMLSAGFWSGCKKQSVVVKQEASAGEEEKITSASQKEASPRKESVKSVSPVKRSSRNGTGAGNKPAVVKQQKYNAQVIASVKEIVRGDNLVIFRLTPPGYYKDKKAELSRYENAIGQKAQVGTLEVLELSGYSQDINAMRIVDIKRLALK
ncbi:MAG: hypothetical protein L0Y74_02315 [candidate division Zixibacteria bacterium]|nr:hypothetical protein [candidate division Zixibacteria bacterium]